MVVTRTDLVDRAVASVCSRSYCYLSGHSDSFNTFSFLLDNRHVFGVIDCQGTADDVRRQVNEVMSSRDVSHLKVNLVILSLVSPPVSIHRIMIID